MYSEDSTTLRRLADLQIKISLPFALAYACIWCWITASAAEVAGMGVVKDPIVKAEQRSNIVMEEKSTSCPQAPPPAKSVDGTAFYTDEKHSVIDPSLFKKAADQEAQVRNYTRQLDNIANNLFLHSSGKDLKRCLIDWLEHWAKAGALTGRTEDNGNNYRVWALTPIAQAFNLVRTDDTISEEKKATIVSWITLLSDINRSYISNKDIRNNISYWASSGFALASISTQDRDLLNYAVFLAVQGINTITSDGYFPGELNRGQRALEYHGFALDPLAITAEVAFANGSNLFTLKDSGLLRVGLNLIKSENDTTLFDERSGVKQDARLPVSIGNYGWAEILNKHHDSKEIKSFLASHRPIIFDRMGGNVTLLYGKGPE